MPVFSPAPFSPARPEAPERPHHPRPSRPLPERPREWDAVTRTADTEQCALIIEAGTHGIEMIAEHYGQGDPDCLDGWTLIMEGATFMRQERPDRCPAWIPDDLPLLFATYGALRAAQDLHAAELATYRAEVSRILDAPDIDPEWARYDMLRASLPERRQAWEEEHGARSASNPDPGDTHGHPTVPALPQNPLHGPAEPVRTHHIRRAGAGQSGHADRHTDPKA